MTSPGTDAAALGAIIARTRYLLLDFDGPICSIFGGLPAPTVAEKLRKLFTSCPTR
jgi:phosphoglycolate phosphatase